MLSIFDFRDNTNNILTAVEMAGQVSGDLGGTMTTHYNVFGGTIFGLHTERHLPFMKGIDTLEKIGCFGFTEVGYGNNPMHMETTATYDPDTKEFVINSPTTLSQKFWAALGYRFAQYCVVFAQTYVKGKNEGVNGFIVPIRDEKLNRSKGVIADDIGRKLSGNGNDCARLRFDHVRIPRTSMLNAINDVDEDGNFKSPYKNATLRFFAATGRLLSGRLFICAIMVSIAKKAIYQTIRYS